MYCPGQYKTNPHKLKIYNDGSVSNNIKYRDICDIENFVVNVVYISYPGFFEIVNNTMVEWYDFWNLIHDMTNIPYDFEILETFIQNYNILNITWIDCNGTWGSLNHDIGKWTGLVGQVNSY